MDKRFIIIGGVGIILILLSTVSVLVFLEIHQAKSEGLAFAKKRNKRACVREVTRGKRICKQVSYFLNNRYFFQTCMDNARPSTSLCNNIPLLVIYFSLKHGKQNSVKK